MIRTLELFACLALLAATAQAADAPPGRVLPIAGDAFVGTLAAAQNWQLTWQTGDTTKQLPAEDLVEWGAPVELPRQTHVLLVDGGVLVAGRVLTREEELIVNSSLLGEVVLPLELVRGVVFNPPADAQRRDELVDRLFATGDERPRDRDLLVLDNGDTLSGTAQSITVGGVQLEADVGEVTIELRKIAALAFSPTLLVPAEEPEGMSALIGFSDGSRLPVVSLATEERQASFGPQGSFLGERPKWRAPLDSLVYLQPRGGKLEYLSELEPAGYRHVPYLTLPWEYREDRNVLGTQLRCGGRLYTRGIGMHSAGRLTYRLDGNHQRFEAELGIDDSTANRGSVTFRVFVDTEQRYASPVIRGGDTPVAISVDVTGGQLLSLIVDYAEEGDELDHADWLNARLEE